MIKNILDGISLQIHEEFGDGYEIYADADVIQNLTEPCFFLAALQPYQDQLVGNRYYRHYPFDIHYFPATQGNNIECYNAAETLLDILEIIQLPNEDVLRGTGINYEIIDDVLHFRVNYNLIVRRNEDYEEMETINVSLGVIDRG